MHGASHGIQLGMEVPHRFLHFIYYRRYQLPIRIRFTACRFTGAVVVYPVREPEQDTGRDRYNVYLGRQSNLKQALAAAGG